LRISGTAAALSRQAPTRLASSVARTLSIRPGGGLASVDRHGGVVHQDVEPPRAVRDVGRCARDTRGVGDVELMRTGVEALLGQRLHRVPSGEFVPGADDDVEPALGEAAGDGEAEAPVAAGDQRDSA
jgi:hypothetical protein